MPRRFQMCKCPERGLQAASAKTNLAHAATMRAFGQASAKRRERRAPHVSALAVLMFSLCWLTPLAFAANSTLTDLKAYPPDINLTSSTDSQRIVLQATYSDGLTRDVTSQAGYKLSNPKLVRLDRSSTLFPLAEGKTDLRISFKGRSLTVPVVVSNASVKPAISFKLDVMPVFMKAGCNAGSCHGSSRGKDGFHLSLFGYDPEGDYFRLTREQPGRLINLGIPEESLIVQKGL